MSAVLEPTPQYFRHPLARYFAATRPAFLLASLVAGLLGLATASHHDALRSVPLALLTLIGSSRYKEVRFQTTSTFKRLTR